VVLKSEKKNGKRKKEEDEEKVKNTKRKLRAFFSTIRFMQCFNQSQEETE